MEKVIYSGFRYCLDDDCFEGFQSSEFIYRLFKSKPISCSTDTDRSQTYHIKPGTTLYLESPAFDDFILENITLIGEPKILGNIENKIVEELLKIYSKEKDWLRENINEILKNHSQSIFRECYLKSFIPKSIREIVKNELSSIELSNILEKKKKAPKGQIKNLINL